MSHFTVLVAAKDEQELEAKLLPYHEYECTGIEQYIEWVDYTAEVMETWETEETNVNPNTWRYDAEAPARPVKEVYENLDEFAKNWFGYDKRTLKDGTVSYGLMTNPNAQWDWYVIGGRWAGALLDKAGNDRSVVPAQELDLAKIQSRMEIELDAFPCYAFIDQDGEWNQRAKMRWFGISDESKATDDFHKAGLEWIATVQKEEGLNFYLVDCHI